LDHDRFGLVAVRHRFDRSDVPVGSDEVFGDHRLNPGLANHVRGAAQRHAAVLIGLVDRGQGVHVLLTKRTEKLRQHAGQIAFPGGAVDAEDGSVERAALREADEEIGLDPQQARIIGRFPDYLSGSGFRIAPVLAEIDPGFLARANPDEVDAVFEVPWAFLMDPANHLRDSREFRGAERHFYRMPYGERMIWGVTAGIIRMAYERLYA
jgi:8-oxo-dGTP pyrophosphatase MutT (NUDIX family)